MQRGELLGRPVLLWSGVAVAGHVKIAADAIGCVESFCLVAEVGADPITYRFSVGARPSAVPLMGAQDYMSVYRLRARRGSP